LNTHTWDSWLRLLRDTLIVIVGAFMLVYETVFAKQPNIDIIAAGLTMLGLPMVLRIDTRSSRDRDQDERKDT
jgi:hypothetical protein